MSDQEITEHAQLMAGGSMCVRPNDPECELIWSTDDWAQSMIRIGGKVFRRTIIVVSDWEEITES